MIGSTGRCVGGAKGGGVGDLTEIFGALRIFGALQELVIAGNSGSLLNEVVQGIFRAEGVDEAFANFFVEPAKVVASAPDVGFIRLVFELDGEHLEFGRIFANWSPSSLEYGFATNEDIGSAVSSQIATWMQLNL